jgi:hypothetical protein
MRSRRDVLRDAKAGIVEDPSLDGRTKVLPYDRPCDRRSFITVSLAATGGLLVALRAEPIAQMHMQMPAQTGPLPFPIDYVQIPTIAS